MRQTNYGALVDAYLENGVEFDLTDYRQELEAADAADAAAHIQRLESANATDELTDEETDQLLAEYKAMGS